MNLTAKEEDLYLSQIVNEYVHLLKSSAPNSASPDLLGWITTRGLSRTAKWRLRSCSSLSQWGSTAPLDAATSPRTQSTTPATEHNKSPEDLDFSSQLREILVSVGEDKLELLLEEAKSSLLLTTSELSCSFSSLVNTRRPGNRGPVNQESQDSLDRQSRSQLTVTSQNREKYKQMSWKKGGARRPSQTYSMHATPQLGRKDSSWYSLPENIINELTG